MVNAHNTEFIGEHKISFELKVCKIFVLTWHIWVVSRKNGAQKLVGLKLSNLNTTANVEGEVILTFFCTFYPHGLLQITIQNSFLYNNDCQTGSYKQLTNIVRICFFKWFLLLFFLIGWTHYVYSSRIIFSPSVC